MVTKVKKSDSTEKLQKADTENQEKQQQMFFLIFVSLMGIK